MSAAAMGVGLSLSTYTLSVLGPSSFKRLSGEVRQHHFEDSVLTSEQSDPSLFFRFSFLVQSTSEGSWSKGVEERRFVIVNSSTRKAVVAGKFYRHISIAVEDGRVYQSEGV